MTDVDVLVVGGGISGLASAWWLGREGLKVEVWERDERIGGKIQTRTAGGYTTERSATLVLNFRSEVDALLAESGLDRVKLPRAPAGNRYLAHGGRMVAVPTRARGFIHSELWSFKAKLRLLVEPLVPRGRREGESVSEFVTRRLGAEVLEKAVEPYVAGPLASDPDQAEARAVLPRLTLLEEQYGSLALGIICRLMRRRAVGCSAESFSFAGGMSTLISTLANAPGIRVLTGTRAVELEPTSRGWRAVSADGRSVHAAHVVLSAPAYAAASLLRPLDIEASALLDGIEYAPISVVHLGLRRGDIRHPLDGTGTLFPRLERLAPLGCMWTSTLLPDRAPEGSVLMDCYLGGARHPAAAEWDDALSADRCLAAMAPLLGISGDPEMIRVDRHPRGLPLYHGRHLARMRAISARLSHRPGLHLAGNFEGGVSVRDRIVSARVLAEEITASLSSVLKRIHSSSRERTSGLPAPAAADAVS